MSCRELVALRVSGNNVGASSVVGDREEKGNL